MSKAGPFVVSEVMDILNNAKLETFVILSSFVIHVKTCFYRYRYN